MITFDDFSPRPGTPIYLQILRYLQRGAAAGRFHDGDELPSRRTLSALLGVNPNTVQKAYRMLEDEGLIQSHTGAKSYMVLDEGKIAAIRAELLESDVREVLHSMKQTGAGKEETLALIARLWEEEEKEETN